MPTLSSRARLLVVLAAPLVTFALLEVGLRLAGFAYPPQAIALTVWNPERDAAMQRGDDFHEVDLAMLWAPAPGRVVRAEDGEVVNADGLRGPVVPRARTPGVVRVALLGESAVFGLGLPLEDTAARQLERLAAERGVQVEVLNAGVVGHSAWQGLARWTSDVRAFAPDLVVVGFGTANERHPCKGLPDEQKLRELAATSGGGLRGLAMSMRQGSRAVHLLAWCSDALKSDEEAPRAARKALQEAREFDRLAADEAGEVDWPGRRRVSLESFGRALLAIAEAVRASDADAVLVAMPRHPYYERDAPVAVEYSAQIASVAETYDVPLLDLRGELFEEVSAGGDARAWFLPSDRLHLSAEGNRHFAEAMLPHVLRLAGR